MAEPTTSGGVGLVAVAVALIGPAAGEYAVIVLSALAGSLWALSRLETASRLTGAALVARLVLTAVALTGGVAYWLQDAYHWPVHQLLAPVAFAIGAFGDRWPALLDRLWQRLIDALPGGAKT